jgi:hypothetical protein
LVIGFELFGERNVGGYIVDVFVKLLKFVKPMWPTNIGVINISLPPSRFEGKGVEGHLLKMLHIEVSDDG